MSYGYIRNSVENDHIFIELDMFHHNFNLDY